MLVMSWKNRSSKIKLVCNGLIDAMSNVELDMRDLVLHGEICLAISIFGAVAGVSLGCSSNFFDMKSASQNVEYVAWL